MARRSKELSGSRQEREGWQRECASLKDAVDSMRLQRKVEQQQQQQRVAGLKASLEERQQLLATTQAALQKTSAQLQETSADRGARLRSAFEVAASLRQMLEQVRVRVRVWLGLGLGLGLG